MFEFIANNIYIFWILVLLFGYLYFVGGDDIIFFRKKKYDIDPKANEKLADALKKFVRSRDFDVMGPATVEFEGQTVSFDSLLLTYAGSVALKVQPEIGEIYSELSTEEWTVIHNGQRGKMANPLKSMDNWEKVLREFYRKEGVKAGDPQRLVVFTNNNCNLVASRHTPACHVVDLERKLGEMKATTDNSANVQAMKAAIEKYIKK